MIICPTSSWMNLVKYLSHPEKPKICHYGMNLVFPYPFAYSLEKNAYSFSVLT